MEKVVINDVWKEIFHEATYSYLVDIDINNVKGNVGIGKESVIETLLHGFTDFYIIYDLENNQINIVNSVIFYKTFPK